MAKSNKKLTDTGQSIPDAKLIHPEMKPIVRNGIERGYQRLLWESLSYVHYEVSDKKLAAEFCKYCAKHFDRKGAAKLKALPDRDFAVIGKYAYLINQGATLDENITNTLQEQYQTLLTRALAVKQGDSTEAPKSGPVISIQERMRQQIQPLCAQWIDQLDAIQLATGSLKDLDPYRDIQIADFVKPAHAKLIREVFEGTLTEAQAVIEWQDEDIKEGYSYMRPRQRKYFLAAVEKIITACDTVINSGRAQRKTRAKKAPDKAKLVSKVKYLESFPELGLASINPVSILDAKTLWTYNTKNRKLGVYVADEYASVLSVKGTTIQGYDPAKSVQKTVRKPQELKGSGKLSRTKFDKLFKELTTTETALNGRLNEHTLLIRVF